MITKSEFSSETEVESEVVKIESIGSNIQNLPYQNSTESSELRKKTSF